MEQTINRYNSPYRIRSKKNEYNEKISKYWFKFVKQTIVSAGILTVFIGCKSFDVIATSEVWEKTTNLIKSDIKVEEVKNGIAWGMEYLKLAAPGILEFAGAIPQEKEVQEAVAVEPAKVEPQVDITLGMTQEEKDVYNILRVMTILRPVNGEITSRYGARNDPDTGEYELHTGTDYAAAVGTQVKSSITGTVIEVKKSNVSLGNYVKIKNSDIVVTYAHCSTIKVKEGDTVKQGDIVALSGNTGNTSGPHLHFEVTKGGRYVNPELLIVN